MTEDNRRDNACAELAKARAALRAAQALRDAAPYDDAASRTYYAACHLISAALLALGVQAQTYNGVSVLLGQHLVKPGLLPADAAKDFALLLGLRNQADYNRYFNLSEQSFAPELLRAERLFALVLRLLAAQGIE